MRQWTATIAAAIVLAYVGIVAVTEVQDYSWWSANLAWLAAFSVVCGALLALISRSAVRSMAVASGLAALIFVAVWDYTLWSLLGDFFSLLELTVSNVFILQVLPRSAVIFGTTFFAGLLAIVAVTTLVPDHYRP